MLYSWPGSGFAAAPRTPLTMATQSWIRPSELDQSRNWGGPHCKGGVGGTWCQVQFFGIVVQVSTRLRLRLIGVANIKINVLIRLRFWLIGVAGTGASVWTRLRLWLFGLVLARLRVWLIVMDFGLSRSCKSI